MGDELVEKAVADSLSISRRTRTVVRNIFIGLVSLNLLGTLYAWYLGDPWLSLGALACTIIAFVVLCFIHHGPHPRKWWAAVWGTEVALNYDFRADLSYEERIKLVEDVEAWTKSEVSRYDVVKVNPWRYHFRRKDQAMLFKMTWL